MVSLALRAATSCSSVHASSAWSLRKRSNSSAQTDLNWARRNAAMSGLGIRPALTPQPGGATSAGSIQVQFIEIAGGDRMVERPSLGVEAGSNWTAPALVFGQCLDQRRDELAAPLRGDELLDAPDGGIVAIGDRQIEPCEAYLTVADGI